VSVQRRYTSRDLDLLPDIEGVRYEIIDGELFVSHSPHADHQYACAVATFALHGWSRQSGLGRTLVGPGLVFSEDDDVIPDVVWSSWERLTSLDEAGHFRAAPDLVVEVLSPGPANERRDLQAKLVLYTRQGVKEYWIVDWRGHTVRVYRRSARTLELATTLVDGETLTSPLLPDFSLAVPELWEPRP
jgi:Uma2 family endonuclease